MHSDDLLSDEEFHVDNSCFDEAISTNMGSGNQSVAASSASSQHDGLSTSRSALLTLEVDEFVAECLSQSADLRILHVYIYIEREREDVQLDVSEHVPQG